jgi:hypothetical protein
MPDDECGICDDLENQIMETLTEIVLWATWNISQTPTADCRIQGKDDTRAGNQRQHNGLGRSSAKK